MVIMDEEVSKSSSNFNDVSLNKTDRPNTTVRAICTFAVYFSVFRPFWLLHSCL